ncbi:MAG: hypothetical protein ACP5E4_01940 [Candidatus Aenigmatarchaeota archaeon]
MRQRRTSLGTRRKFYPSTGPVLEKAMDFACKKSLSFGFTDDS